MHTRPVMTMTDALLPDDDTSQSSWSSDADNRRFVIDFTVGPPGVGPVTTQANDAARAPHHLSDELEDHRREPPSPCPTGVVKPEPKRA